MARTNRQLVDMALEYLRDALQPVVAQTLDPLAGGLEWTKILEELDRMKGRHVREGGYSAGDLHVLLRVTTERLGDIGFPFDFSRAVSSYLNEAAALRNSHAHMEKYTSDDTLRALDTVSRLLTELGDTAGARALGKARADLNRRIFAEQTRADARTAFADLGDDDLSPWHEVLEPHPDVKSGRFKESEFAANLWSVAHNKGDAGPEYRDPVEFFRRTYMTEGLSDLLRQSAGRVSGSGNGAPVINLQTTFGGGKTHSMLAVWHLFGGTAADDLPDDVGGIARDAGVDGLTVARAAVVGHELPVAQPVIKPDGTTVRTIWGEIAWQLGGAEGYAYVADADRTGTSPASALRDLFDAYSPCIVLIDEWVAYARQLHGRDDLVAGSFDTQFSFAQALTEAASQTPGALVLVSIPASDARVAGEDQLLNDLETGGTHGREALGRLEHVVGRTAHQWQPATSTESFEIVRRRLFIEPDDTAARKIAATARKFVEFYRNTAGELPVHVREGAYEERIRQAFPIHPELFDRLYEDWSTLERFQRTRGVLRLMSTVVKTLLDAGDKSSLIMPGSVPVGSAAVTSEFMQYVEPSWRAVIDTDVEGENANAVGVDRERQVLGKRHTTVRLARALFIASAATHLSAHKGVNASDLFLGVAMPGDVLGNFNSALSLLEGRATYVFHDSSRHWLDIAPSLNRMARDRATAMDSDDVDRAVVEWVKRASDDPGRLFQHVIVSPEDGADVPEHEETRLVILGASSPHRARQESEAHTVIRGIVGTRGASGRTRRNTVVFLAPDAQRLDEVRGRVRDHLAWRSIVDDTQSLDLRHEQAATARRRMDEDARAVEAMIATTWIWAIAPRQQDGSTPEVELNTSKADNSETRLAVRAAEKFADMDELRSDSYAPALIRVDLDNSLFSVWNRGHISVEKLWELHTTYLYLPRLRNQAILRHGVESVLEDAMGGDLFWLAEQYDDQEGRYVGLAEPVVDAHSGFTVTESTLLVRPEIARQQKQREDDRALREDGRAAETSDPSRPDGYGTDAVPQRGGLGAEGRTVHAPHGGGPAPSRSVANARFHLQHEFDPAGDLTAEITTLAEEILENLQAGVPDGLRVRIEVDADKTDGFDERTVRNVSENARTLGVDHVEFEDS